GVKVNVKSTGDPRAPKVKYASAHDLRRSFGERWAARVMPQILMQLMRHASIDTTLRYYVGQNAEKAADVLWDAMAGKASNTSGNSLPSGQSASSGQSSQPVARNERKEMRVSGLEPETYGLKVRCSTN